MHGSVATVLLLADDKEDGTRTSQSLTVESHEPVAIRGAAMALLGMVRLRTALIGRVWVPRVVIWEVVAWSR